jgi:hypothetical protein
MNQQVKVQRDLANRALRDAVAQNAPPETLQDLAHVAAETSGVFWIAKLQEAMLRAPEKPKHRL